MIFSEAPLKNAFLIEPEKNRDERGFFARSYCAREFEAHGLTTRFVQCNISFNAARGTLRGMHFQRPPYAEAKLVRCTRGAIFDVIIDLREGSPTFRKHFGVCLDEDNRLMLYVPAGFAHGFITLKDETEVFYQMSEFYVPQSAGGLRWDDPFFQISWPLAPTRISERDCSYPDYGK